MCSGKNGEGKTVHRRRCELTYRSPLKRFSMWLQMVRRHAICLREANEMSTRIRFFPTRVSSKSICLNDLVTVPRGPLTVTVRHLHDTATARRHIQSHRHTCPSLNNTSQTLVDSLITRSEAKDIHVRQKGEGMVDCFFTLTGIRPIEWLMATILRKLQLG